MSLAEAAFTSPGIRFRKAHFHSCPCAPFSLFHAVNVKVYLVPSISSETAQVERIKRLPYPVMPYYCTKVMRQCIKKGLTTHPQSFGENAVARGIDISISQLSMQYADMARTRDTPQPACFRVMLHMFTIIYLVLLPTISYDALGYWAFAEGEKNTNVVRSTINTTTVKSLKSRKARKEGGQDTTFFVCTIPLKQTIWFSTLRIIHIQTTHN